MLPAAFRMRASKDFDATVRGGVRAGCPTVVVHARGSAESSPMVGFVVSRKVGNAVVRNRVKRRLRHLVAPLVAEVPTGMRFVVRATPIAASEPDRLGEDLAHAWAQCLRKLQVSA